MKSGRSDIEVFKVPINRKDIAEIEGISRQLRISDQAFIKSAPYEDVMTAYALLALQEFLSSRRVEPGFEVVLSE